MNMTRTHASSPLGPSGTDGDALAHLLRVLRRRWLIVASVIVVCCAIAVINDKRTPNEYKTTASVAFGVSTLTDNALNIQRGGADPAREAGTKVLIAKSPEVASGVRKRLATSISSDDLIDLIDVEAKANANVIDISATYTDPVFASRVANGFARQYIEFQRDSQTSQIDAARRSLQSQRDELPIGSSQRADLNQQLGQLAAARAVASSDARIIGLAGIPSTPSGLSVKVMLVLAAIVGAAVGMTLIFLLESIDRRVSSIESVEDAYRSPALASIPAASFKSRKAADRAASLEPYRILRSSLDFVSFNRPLQTLLVTSAVPGEGKTTVSVDLAHTLALTGRRVVLVEADLRRPTFARHFDLDPRIGLTSALLDEAPLEDILVQPFADLPDLRVLPSGRLPPNPSELLGSAALTDTITTLRETGATVVIDAPPLNPVSDTQVMLNNPLIDGAIVVARLNLTTHDEIARARAILDRHLVDPLGVVVTGVRNVSRYGYEVDAGAGPGHRGDDGNVQNLPTQRRARRVTS